MKNINWKLFFILLSACVVTGLMTLPYALSLIHGETIELTPVLVLGTIIQTTIIFSIAILVGLSLSKCVGLSLPILEAWSKGEKQTIDWKVFVRLPIGLGVLAGVLIIGCSFLFQSLSSIFLSAEIGVVGWKTVFASFYGGIAEEVLLRLFLMTFFVWIAWKIKKTPEGKPTSAGVWTAIIISSIIFGLGHLPITGAVTAITATVVLRAIILNGIGGVIFGWLYWKKGLESAMVSHFSADIVIHVITPLVASIFIKG